MYAKNDVMDVCLFLCYIGHIFLLLFLIRSNSKSEIVGFFSTLTYPEHVKLHMIIGTPIIWDIFSLGFHVTKVLPSFRERPLYTYIDIDYIYMYNQYVNS